VTLLDTWHTTGMRGTGSHHFEATDVFVPETRVFSTSRPDNFQPGVLFRTSRAVPWSASIAGVSLGIARDAIDSFIEIARTKSPGSLGTSLTERDSVHRAVGEAEGRLRSARLFLLDTARQVGECFARGEDVPDELGALMRCAASTASLSATAVVDALYTAAGSGGIYITSRLDRCFRDIHTLITHTVGGIAGLPVAGRYYLGLGLANPL
jgi:indole-3-acetate monooxygenase